MKPRRASRCCVSRDASPRFQTGSERIAAIARDYAAQPENTIIVSPDNRSRQQINEAVRAELRQSWQACRTMGRRSARSDHRSDMTGADRTWAARYNAGDVLQYTTGSKERGHRARQLRHRSVRRCAGEYCSPSTWRADQRVTYDPRRLKGVNVFRETGARVRYWRRHPVHRSATKSLASPTAILAPDPAHRRWHDDRANGWQRRAHVTFDTAEVAAVRSRLCRDLAQLAGTHCRAAFWPTSTPKPRAV